MKVKAATFYHKRELMRNKESTLPGLMIALSTICIGWSFIYTAVIIIIAILQSVLVRISVEDSDRQHSLMHAADSWLVNSSYPCYHIVFISTQTPERHACMGVFKIKPVIYSYCQEFMYSCYCVACNKGGRNLGRIWYVYTIYRKGCYMLVTLTMGYEKLLIAG